MLRLITGLLGLLVMGTSVMGMTQFALEDFVESGQTSSGFGVLQIGDYTYGKTTLSKDFEFSRFDVGADLIFYIPFDSDAPYPEDASFINFRHIGYTDDHNQFRWGRLRGVTMGQGLLMESYDSGSFGSTTFGLDKAGFLGRTQFGHHQIDTLYTASSVIGVRYQRPLPEGITFFGVPILVGATYVTDTDGVDRTYEGTTITRPEQDGYAFDAAVPIAGDFLIGFGEYTKLVDHGDGAAIGIRGYFGEYLANFSYRLQYLRFGADFVPSYFNSSYEATPFNFSTDASTETTNGFLGSASADIFGGYFRGGAQIESYTGRDPLFTASLGWRRIANTVGVVNYTLPFNGEDYQILTADVLFITGSWMNYVTRYKRIYYEDGEYTESYEVGGQMSLNNLLPFM